MVLSSQTLLCLNRRFLQSIVLHNMEFLADEEKKFFFFGLNFPKEQRSFLKVKTRALFQVIYAAKPGWKKSWLRRSENCCALVTATHELTSLDA